MANEEEMESFEISEQDLEDALQPGSRRYHKESKDQNIYGVFNYVENEPHSSLGNRYRPNKKFKQSNYTTPLGFVKGGTHQQGDIKEEKKGSQSGNASESDDESGSVSLEDQIILDSLKHKSQGKTFTPAPFKESHKSAPGKQRYFGGAPFQASGTSTGLGEWEKSTKGIGSKLLMQMGYEPGKGLGKSLQGRTAPIEANVRKGRGAIGAYGAETKNEPNKFAGSEDEEENNFKRDLAQWKHEGAEGTPSSGKKKEKIRYTYRTSEEVIEEVTKGGVHKMAREYSEISKVKVIDMTGPEQRVLSGYSALSVKKTSEPMDSEATSQTLSARDKLQLDKLAYNLDALVDFCEHEIIGNAKELTHNQDRVVALDEQVKSLNGLVSKEQKQITSLSSMLEVLEQFEVRLSQNQLDIDYLLEKFTFLERHYDGDYVTNDLANVALTYLIPLLKARLIAVWRPLDLPDESIRRLLQSWRPLLECRSRITKGNVMDPYHGLLWHGWMPTLRGIIGQWRCKEEAEPMVNLLERWGPLVPDWIMDNILGQLILPRIQAAVDAWNPLTDMIPIHAWIHPWLPRLNNRLDVIYPTIRQKMAQALVTWEPSDQSARSVLMPWVSVFSKGSMDAFLIKNILPKLHKALVNMAIDPMHQQMDVWKWVMHWKDLMPVASMVALLNECFFPKWLEVLVRWLNNSPNYEEIMSWYTGWKTQFPRELIQQNAVKEQFQRFLELMNRSLANTGHMVAPPPMVAPVMPPMMPMVNPAVLGDQFRAQTCRDMVEFQCAQRGIIFAPANRWEAGRPVYRVGNMLSYFEQQMVYILDPSTGIWDAVTSVPKVMDMASA